MTAERVKVAIRCKRCGELFILRGKKQKGIIETGFKQCFCENTTEFEIMNNLPFFKQN